MLNVVLFNNESQLMSVFDELLILGMLNMECPEAGNGPANSV
jgi:hypothetical protein